MKRYNLGDLVAANMDETLNSDEFKKIFAKPGPVVKTIVATNPSLDAFNRFAQFAADDKKDDKDDEEKEEKGKSKKGKPKKGKMPPWLQKGKKKKKKDDDDNDASDVNFAKDKKEDKEKAKEEKAKAKEEAKEEKAKEKEEKKKEKEEAKKAKKKDAMLALHYIVDSLSKTSAVLDEMGYERSSMAALQALDIIVREASVKTAHDEDGDEEFDDEELEQQLDKDLFGPEPRSELGLPEEEDSETEMYPDLRPSEERDEDEPFLEAGQELEFDANDADAPAPAKSAPAKPVPAKPKHTGPAIVGPSTGPVMPDRKPNAPFMHQVPGAAGKPMAPAKKPAPAWNRPKMEPTEINMSDDCVSPSKLKSSIDPKLIESGEGHVHHADCNDAHIVDAFKSLDKWVKNGDDIDSL